MSPPEQLPKLERLKTRRQFLAVAKGLYVARGAVLVQDLPRDPPALEPLIGLGFTATKKIGGAVVRNRAKRRLRDIFRRSQRPAGPPNSPALDFVVIPRRELVAAPFAVIQSEFRRAIDRSRTVYPS